MKNFKKEVNQFNVCVLKEFIGFGANVNAGGVWKHFGKYLHFWAIPIHNTFNLYLHLVNVY